MTANERQFSTSFTRLLHGLGANLFGQVITVIIQIIGVPILLHAWGTTTYGEWLVLFSIPAYLSLTDLGFAQSAGNDMAQHVARGERASAVDVFRTLASLVFSVITVGAIVVSILIYGLPIHHWLHLTSFTLHSQRWILEIFAIDVLIAMPEYVFHAGFRATGDYAFHVIVMSVIRFGQYLAVWICATIGREPVVAACSFLAVQACGTIASGVLLKLRHPWLKFGIVKPRRAIVRRLAAPAVANISLPLAQVINLQGMVVVIGATLGGAAVVTFSTLRTLSRLVVQLVLAVSHAAEPELAAAYGAGDAPALRSLFHRSIRIALFLASLASLGLVFFGRRILATWTHGKIHLDPWLFRWLITSALSTVVWYGALSLLRAANVHIRAALLYCFASAFAVAFAGVALHYRNTLSDAGLALLIVDAAMAGITFRAAKSLLDASAAKSTQKPSDSNSLIPVGRRPCWYVVSHAYLEPELQKNLDALAKSADVVWLTPKQHSVLVFPHREVSKQDPKRSFHVVAKRTLSLTPAQYLFLSVGSFFRRYRPDVLFIEYDPWQVIFWQLILFRWLWAPRCAVIVCVKKNTFRKTPYLSALIRRYLALRGLRRVARVLTASGLTRQLYMDEFGVPSDRIEVQPHMGVDIDHFVPGSRSTDGRFVVGYAGKICARKGVETLILAVRKLRSETGQNIWVELAGPIEADVLELMQEPFVTWKGCLPNSEMPAFLRNIDVFALLSWTVFDHQEHDARALLEAMACAKPCIGSSTGIISELINDDNGLLVPERDVDAVTKAILGLASSREKCTTLGRNARRFVENSASLETVHNLRVNATASTKVQENA